MDSITIDGMEYRIFDRLYAVSEYGHFMRGSIQKGFKEAKPVFRPDGYLSVGRQRLAHRMVAFCWVPNPTGAKLVHHKNGNRADNRASNLEWVTPKKHMGKRHSDTVGRHSVSEEQKQHLRDLRTGSKQSRETCEKRSKTLKAMGHRPPSWAGKNHSDETKAKMSANNGMSCACQIYGVVFPSFAAAGRALGQKSLSLRKRCISANFPEYRVIRYVTRLS